MTADHRSGSSAGSASSLRTRLLLFTLLATVFDGAELTLLAYFFPTLSHDFHVGVPTIVAINTLQGLASLVGGLCFGPIGDRFGRRTTMLLTVFLYGAATVAGAVAHSLSLFTATRVVAGLGIGGEFGAAFSIFNELWEGRGRGRLGAMVQNMFVVGITCTTLVGYLTTSGGVQSWRQAYLVVGICSLVIWTAVFLWMPESPLWREYAQARRRGALPPEFAVSGSTTELFRRGLASTTLVGCTLASGIFFINYSLVLYEPTLLSGIHHLTAGATTDVLLLGYGALFCGSLTAGAIADVRGRRVAAMSLAAVALVGYAAYLWTWNAPLRGAFLHWPLFWALVTTNFGCGCIGVVGVWLGELYPTRGVNCCPICLTNRDNRCSCRPNPACAGCPWFPLPLRRRSRPVCA